MIDAHHQVDKVSLGNENAADHRLTVKAVRLCITKLKYNTKHDTSSVKVSALGNSKDLPHTRYEAIENETQKWQRYDQLVSSSAP